MLAIDLHTVRDPKRSEERLDLGAIFVLRIPFEDVSTSKKMNSAHTMTQEGVKIGAAPQDKEVSLYNAIRCSLNRTAKST